MKKKRTKYVYSSSAEVFHLWANQTQESARQGGSRTRSFFEGTSCYSYGHHYRVGYITTYKGTQIAVINTRGYSPTTSKHIGEARNAVTGLMPYVEGTSTDVRECLVEMQDALIDRLMSTVNSLRFYKGSEALDKYDREEFHNFNALCLKLGHNELILEPDYELLSILQAHIAYRLQRQEELSSPEAEAKKDAARARKQELEMLKNQDVIAAWRTGYPSSSFIMNLKPQLIRVNGNDIETSGGARVPLADGLKLLKAILKGKAKPGNKIGNYTFNQVSKQAGPDGPKIIQIGCHRIELSEAVTVLERYLGTKLSLGKEAA